MSAYTALRLLRGLLYTSMCAGTSHHNHDAPGPGMCCGGVSLCLFVLVAPSTRSLAHVVTWTLGGPQTTTPRPEARQECRIPRPAGIGKALGKPLGKTLFLSIHGNTFSTVCNRSSESNINCEWGFHPRHQGFHFTLPVNLVGQPEGIPAREDADPGPLTRRPPRE